MRGSSEYILRTSPALPVPAQQEPSWNFNFSQDQLDEQQPPLVPSDQTPVKIKIPPMAPSTRRSTRQRTDSNASGSVYNASNASMDVDDEDAPNDDEENDQPPESPKEYGRTRSGRRIVKKSYVESEPSDDELNVLDQKIDSDPLKQLNGDANGDVNGDDDEGSEVGGHLLRRRKSKLNGIVESEDESPVAASRYGLRNRRSDSAATRPNGNSNGRSKSSRRQGSRSSKRLLRRSTRSAKGELQNEDEADDYVDEPDSSTGSADVSLDEAIGTSEHEDDLVVDGDAEGEPEPDQEDGKDERPYALRQRAKINYAIPPPLEDMRPPSPKPRRLGRTNSRVGGRKVPGWSASGAELSRWMGGAGDDSVRLAPSPRSFIYTSYLCT